MIKGLASTPPSERAVGGRDRSVAFRVRRWLERRDIAFVAIALSLLLAVPSLFVGLLLDDHSHRVALTARDELPALAAARDLFVLVPGSAESVRASQEAGHTPWWAPDSLQIAFWRPLAALTHRLDYALFPDSPALMHAHSLLWLGALVAAAAALYRRVLTTAWVAGLAALLYAIDDAHAVPAGWLANRHALVGTTLALLAFLAHRRFRNDGWWYGALLGPLAFAAGLLASEIAIGLLAFILAYALFLDSGRRLARLASLVPYLVVAAVWHAAYVALGYGTSSSGLYVDPGKDPAGFASALVERGPILLFSQLSGAQSGLHPFLAPDGQLAVLVISCLGIGVIAWVLAPLLRRDAKARFFAFATLLAVMPQCATFSNDRLLLLSGVAGLGLVAHGLGWLFEGAGAHARSLPARAVAATWVVTHGLLAPLLFPAQISLAANAGEVTARAATTAPVADTTRTLVLVNAPDTLLCTSVPIVRASLGAPVPERTRCLGVTQRALEVTRDSERSLLLRPEGGYLASTLDTLFRAPALPMSAGDSVVLSDSRYDVLEVTPEGRPAAVRITFTQPLDSDELGFAVWLGDHYVPFRLPRVGETQVLPASQILDLLF